MGSEAIQMNCPNCGAVAVKNGIRNGGQTYQCKDCSHAFMGDPSRRRLPRHKIDLVNKLLIQGVKPSQIAQAIGISKRQVYFYKKVLNG